MSHNLMKCYLQNTCLGMSRVMYAELITNFVICHQNCLLSNHVSLCYFISCLLVCSRIFFINGI